MFYSIRGGEILRTDIDHLAPDCISVGYLTLKQLQRWREQLGIDETVIGDCIQDKDQFRTSVDIYDEYSFGIINMVDLMDVMSQRDRVAFIIKKNLFLVVKILDLDNSSMQNFEGAVGRFRHNATMEKVVYGIFDRMLTNGNRALEECERQIIGMEREVVEGDIDLQLNRQIFDLRHRLSIVHNYYEQLVDIGEALQENENDIFPTEDLRYIKIFTDKANRLSMNAQSLSENLIHLREALDAAMNYAMSTTMKVFTVVSTIFLPLTLLVGWYGMNFHNMPELAWKYGYLGVVIASIVIVILILLLFKWKKLL